MYPGYNRSNSSRKPVDMARYGWVVLLPEEPRLARLVYVNGRWMLVFDDGSMVPVVVESSAGSGAGLEPLPEPDYDAFYRWCVRGTSAETCRRYTSYLRRLPWPLTVDRLYEFRLTKWYVLALRAYLSFLEERGLDVRRWRELRALRLQRSRKDKYVPEPDEVRRSLEVLEPQYRLIYYVILYTGFRLEHVLRLISEWRGLRSRVQEIAGGCVRIVLPPSWTGGVKREFYAYMPRWLYEAVDRAVEQGYRVPRRESVTRRARRVGAVPPKYVRKFALSVAARILSPDAAAHMAGHEEGAELTVIPKAASTQVTVERYASIEDLVRAEYHRYARWLEENVAPSTLLTGGQVT